ncbi:MAG TPA: hypothetical protein VGU44_06260 [Gammaproteobacteria bacterium]|nr:hypothetical protein [Gammaproteobacteria bacterium]
MFTIEDADKFLNSENQDVMPVELVSGDRKPVYIPQFNDQHNGVPNGILKLDVISRGKRAAERAIDKPVPQNKEGVRRRLGF